MSKPDPLKPSAALLCKLGSIAAHVDEGLSVHGHQFDWTATASLLVDPEVTEWMTAMRKMAMLPEPRNKKERK